MQVGMISKPNFLMKIEKMPRIYFKWSIEESLHLTPFNRPCPQQLTYNFWQIVPSEEYIFEIWEIKYY